MGIRRATAAGQAPSALLGELGVTSPLEAMLELSSAWHAKLAELGAAGAFVRGELGEADADAALRSVASAHADDWQLGLRIGEALTKGQLDGETLRLAEARGIRTLVWLVALADLPLGAAKSVAGRLAAMGPGALEPGVLAEVLAEERAVHLRIVEESRAQRRT
jgi:hypothetical protein